jgi:hypothetical protein
MLKTVTILLLSGALSATGFAQQAKPPAATTPEGKANPPVEQPRAPEPPALPINIKIEVSISDQTGTGQPAKKVVSMIASDRSNTNIRSSASVPVKGIGGNFNYRNVTINVDARPAILAKEPTKILLGFGLEYMPKAGGNVEEIEPGMASLSERLSLILESGKPMLVSQAADPTSDRKITVEVTATILK